MRKLSLKTMLKATALVLSVWVVCSCSDDGKAVKKAMKVGMVTDAGTIDDKLNTLNLWVQLRLTT